MVEWYSLNAETVLSQLKTNKEQGLSQDEIERRTTEYGPNELVEQGRISPWRILWEQLTALMVLILIIAAAISALIGNFKDAAAIMAIVILSAALGFAQDYRAEKAMAALKRLAVPAVKVRRKGHVLEISARALLPGDIVLLEMGNVVPADGRLLESVNLRVQEAALTGESEPVEKVSETLSADNLALADRRNMVYMGTTVTYGRGAAVITETGMKTELGRIATMIQSVEREQTPLQQRLDEFGRWLAILALAGAGLVFIMGLLNGEEIKLMFMTAISIAVAIVPEALPAIVTIALALGAQRMLKRHVLVRKLPAVETLGSVTVICSDKTGTLTQNRMAVSVLETAGHSLDLSQMSGHNITPNSLPPAMRLLLAGSTLCSDAVLELSDNGLAAVGDPTEGALVMAAAQFGLEKTQLERVFPRVAEIPFTSARKLMTTIHTLEMNEAAQYRETCLFRDSVLAGSLPPYLAFSKGATDNLLDASGQVWVNGQLEPLTDDWRMRIQTVHENLARGGMRALALAFNPLSVYPAQIEADLLEQDLIFVGLVGLIDPPRPEAQQAVQTCQTAGIRPVMITGDHPLTAQRIAQDLGIATNGRVLTGQDLAQKPAEALKAEVGRVPVYARVAPEHKLNIVTALQEQGHIVAMTGDGVNDAPALKKADIGVAMGVGGTDVAREAAEMVLLDDNFASIVAAVEEGRVIYDNVRKYLEFSVAGNFGKILVILLGPLFGMPLPLLPLQILWMNLVTDGLLALGLSVEPAERNTMRRPPYSPKESILGRGLGRHIVGIGLAIGLIALAVGVWAWGISLAGWQTMILTVLIFSQIGQALAIRSRRDSLFSIGLFSNKMLLGMILATIGLQLAVIYVPFLQEFFHTTALSPAEFVVTVLAGAIIFFGIEAEKWVLRRQTS